MATPPVTQFFKVVETSDSQLLIVDANGALVAEVCGDWPDPATANAAFICRAMNYLRDAETWAYKIEDEKTKIGTLSVKMALTTGAAAEEAARQRDAAFDEIERLRQEVKLDPLK